MGKAKTFSVQELRKADFRGSCHDEVHGRSTAAKV